MPLDNKCRIGNAGRCASRHVCGGHQHYRLNRDSSLKMTRLQSVLYSKLPEVGKIQSTLPMMWGQCHRAKPTKDIVKGTRLGPLAHAAYSPDLATFDYLLFASLGHALADQRFTSYENVKSWLDDWLAQKTDHFFSRGIYKLPKRWGKCVASKGYYFE
ncbi:mariner Mos1 transposase [Trichonephila clavipes]|nr:mariner Mos1 transposase [Trichonephila clavipes]